MALVQVNWKPQRRQLRTFGFAGAAAAAGVGTWTLVCHALPGFAMAPGTARATAAGLWIAAAALAALAVAWPVALRPVYLVLATVTLPVGIVLSYLTMAVLFYGVFTPIGLFFRLIGRDPLHRRFQPEADTYWVARRPATDVRRYFRQF
jgi:hypothetical protein